MSSSKKGFVCNIEGESDFPAETLTLFNKLYEECSPRMRFEEGHEVKVQVRFGKMVFREELECKNVDALRRLLAGKTGHSFVTEAPIEGTALFEQEALRNDVYVLSVAFNGRPYFMTLFRNDNHGCPQNGIDLGNGFSLVEVCIAEQILGRIDTLNSSCPDIRVQIQQQQFIRKGDLYDKLLQMARGVKEHDDFVEIDTVAGFDVYHIRRKRRSRYVLDDFLWDVSDVRSWDYQTGFSQQDRFEVELSSNTFWAVVAKKLPKEKLADVDWEALFQHAWEIAATF